ncbi:MAG: phenylalanine--tRNA ligase subunit beta [Elusimicrobiota bacterium]
MKTLFSWLQEFNTGLVSFDELCRNLASLGFSIDGAEKTGFDGEKVFVAEILKIERHPNADRLSLCEVSTGDKIHKVVCGAKNIAVGQKVPFAVVGARLPEGILKKAKIRGVESEGMICSAGELGLTGYDDSGILVLDSKMVPGTDIREIFDRPDYVFELEITPNLGYCLSHYALARELSIFKNYGLKEPDIKITPARGEKAVSIEIENPSDCYRYFGLVVKNISQKATPAWMAERLRKIGINPKNDILIDASNYVMFELGQPTHCFDMRNLENSKVIVRRAASGEKIKTLDGEERELSPEIMVIADSRKPVAVAGVMGGYYSSIAPDTSDILIESAHFNPSAVRRSSRLLNLKSDSSFRFERNIDSELQEKAAYRIANLIMVQNPNAVLVQAEDVRPYRPQFQPIEAKAEKINSILGSSFSQQEIDKVFRALNPHYSSGLFTPPSYRADLRTVWDMAEEVARYMGYSSIKSETSMKVMSSREHPYHSALNAIRERLCSIGLSEVVNYDLISLKELRSIMFNEKDAVELKNPLSADFHYLRPSLISSLLKNLKYNLNRGAESVMIYENGKIFRLNEGKISEKSSTAGLMFGKLRDQYWRFGEEFLDFYHVKGAVAHLFRNAEKFELKPAKNPPHYFQAGICMEIYAFGYACGYVGAISCQTLSSLDIKESEVYAFEFDTDVFARAFDRDFYASIKKAVPVSQYQQSMRDLCVVVSKKYTWEEIKKETAGISDLLWVKLIDVYAGKNLPPDTRSLTLRFMFSSMEKTFTDKELNSKVEEIYNRLNKTFNASLRS